MSKKVNQGFRLNIGKSSKMINFWSLLTTIKVNSNLNETTSEVLEIFLLIRSTPQIKLSLSKTFKLDT